MVGENGLLGISKCGQSIYEEPVFATPGAMPLNLLKLCVGVSEIEELDSWVKDCRQGRGTLDHVTRMFPKRKDEILPGGSLFWVMRGMILCRQPIAALEEVTGSDGIVRCRILFKPQVIPVRPVPKRAFQGWRYFDPSDAPPDVGAGQGDDAMMRELSELGLL